MQTRTELFSVQAAVNNRYSYRRRLMPRLAPTLRSFIFLAVQGAGHIVQLACGTGTLEDLHLLGVWGIRADHYGRPSSDGALLWCFL